MFVYLLIALLAVSAGIMFGVEIRPPFRWAGVVAGVLVVGAVVGAGIILGRETPWSAPLFAVVAPVTAVLISAEARRDEPLFRAQSYWQRVLLIVSSGSAGENARPETGEK